MKVLVLGSGGRLGAALTRELASGVETLGLGRGELDLAAADAITEVLDCHEFDVLINCAALTNVDYCETHRDEAFAVNAIGPGIIAQVCARRGARMIHISTDYVFSGNRDTPYLEEGAVHPVSVYGEAKQAGEEEVLNASAAHLVIRVAWVFGPDRPSFIDMIIQRALDSDQVEAVEDKFSSPSYTLDLVEWIRALLKNPEASGILHLCNSGVTSWRAYGQHALGVAAECGLPLKTSTVDGIALDSLTAFIARRPIFTGMSTARFTGLTGVTPRPWQEAVEQYVRTHVVPSLAD